MVRRGGTHLVSPQVLGGGLDPPRACATSWGGVWTPPRAFATSWGGVWNWATPQEHSQRLGLRPVPSDVRRCERRTVAQRLFTPLKHHWTQLLSKAVGTAAAGLYLHGG